MRRLQLGNPSQRAVAETAADQLGVGQDALDGRYFRVLFDQISGTHQPSSPPFANTGEAVITRPLQPVQRKQAYRWSRLPVPRPVSRFQPVT